MARVSLDQKALTDSRFTHLGLALGADRNGGMAHALGMGVMLTVWNECQEQETYELEDVAVDAIGVQIGYIGQSLCRAILAAGLATRTRRKIVYVNGTKGRIEWLAERRAEGREGGKKGGRPPKDNKPVGVDVMGTPGGLRAETPPTPTPTPTPTQLQDSENYVSSAIAEDGNAELPVLVFPTNGAGPKTWDLARGQVEEWGVLFAGLDIEAECKKALAWVRANRPKTARGMKRYLVGWLTRANDKGGGKGEKLTLRERNLKATEGWGE